MAYTQNESIDWLTAITPTTDDIVVTMDQAEIGVAKTSTLLSIYNLFKTTYDTIYAKYLGDADFYQYSIVRTVASGNLTVALKNYEGNDPTPTKPVKYKTQDGIVRTITSATSITLNAWTSYFNAGSAELATKEIDYFVYIIDWAGWAFQNIGICRVPDRRNLAEVAYWGNLEKYMEQAGNAGTENCTLIGRFNATLSAGAGYTWSIPATSVIINSPIYETRWLEYNSTLSASGSMTISSSLANINKYMIRGNTLEFFVSNTFTTGGTASNDVTASLPFNYWLDNLFSWIPCYDTADFISSGIISGSLIKVRKNNTTWTLGTWRVFWAQWFYNI